MTSCAVSTRPGIANGRLNDVHDFAAHDQLRARDRWRPIATENGEIDALLPPATLDGVEPAMGAVPRVGQHNDAVLGRARLRSRNYR